MKRIHAALALILALILAAGCGTTRSVQPGDTRNIFKQYTVRSEALWARGRFRNVEVWTVDGPQLQQLRFYRALEDGDSLFEIPVTAVLIPPSTVKRQPKYRAGMLPHEVAEMVTATLMQWGAVDAVARRIQPATLGGRDGFRFEIEFYAGGGARYRALLVGTTNPEKHLHLVWYMGAEDVYYPKFLAEVENILRSLTWM